MCVGEQQVHEQKQEEQKKDNEQACKNGDCTLHMFSRISSAWSNSGSRLTVEAVLIILLV